MEWKIDFRWIVISSHPDIHKDLIKILTSFRERGLPQFQIDTTNQEQEGIEKIRTAFVERKPYALAFVDTQTVKQIWNADPNIQAVICVTSSDDRWKEVLDQLGINNTDFLILKEPFDSTSVRQIASALTQKWYLKHIENQSVSMIHATLESSSDGVLVANNAGKITYYNHKFVELWEVPNFILSAGHKDIFFEYASKKMEKPREFLEKIKRVKEGSPAVDADVTTFQDGRVFEWYTQPQKLDQDVIGRVWSFRDITERKYLEKRLEHQATHDALTDLPNRIFLVDCIEQAINMASRKGRMVGIFFFDLDRFKLINDNFDHASGDEFLKNVAKRLRNSSRRQDTLARLGGDEFVLVVTDIKRESDLIKIASKLLKIIKEPYKMRGKEIVVTSSIGISIFPRDGANAGELLRTADLAMYRAKEAGANQFQFYTVSLNDTSMRYLQINLELQHAIENHEFFLCYQPQINFLEKRIIAVEALIRWKHPKRGVVLPMDFIPVAEEMGFILPIGEWVLKTACRQAKLWQDKNFPSIRVAVNVSTLQIKNMDFSKKIQEILRETGLQPEFLEIELTENVILGAKEIYETIDDLKKIGLRIVLDDFGTGNSSLNYLRKIKVDSLKIDKSFVERMNVDKNNDVILKAIITMASGLNLDVIAEGIETKEQLDILKERDCQNGQGFYFSKPVSAEEIEKIFTKRNF